MKPFRGPGHTQSRQLSRVDLIESLAFHTITADVFSQTHRLLILFSAAKFNWPDAPAMYSVIYWPKLKLMAQANGPVLKKSPDVG